MGPFVPDLISDQLNLVVAFILGIGFGFVLEQAGFSSSRRLAGIFYGYDFTVLRVFFTAAVTAMSGVLLLGYFGLLDTEAIYVNPTWLVPAIVGGAIMGVGFILGGYCPGTSVCAAAIGKVDAMFFVGGGIVGVFGFGELYPLYKGFYESSSLGPIKIFDSLGISQGAFALMLIGAAVAAFAATTLIEKRVDKVSAPSLEFKTFRHVASGMSVLALGVIFVFLPDRKTHLIDQVSRVEYVNTHSAKIMSADELAFLIVDREPKLRIIDLRSASGYAKRALPGSSNVSMRDLFGKEWSSLLSRVHDKKVIIAEDESSERTAYFLLQKLGYENLAMLEGGFPKFEGTILSNTPFIATGSRWDEDVMKFRTAARIEITKRIEEEKNSALKPVSKLKKIQGGC